MLLELCSSPGCIKKKKKTSYLHLCPSSLTAANLLTHILEKQACLAGWEVPSFAASPCFDDREGWCHWSNLVIGPNWWKHRPLQSVISDCIIWSNMQLERVGLYWVTFSICLSYTHTHTLAWHLNISLRLMCLPRRWIKCVKRHSRTEFWPHLQ